MMTLSPTPSTARFVVQVHLPSYHWSELTPLAGLDEGAGDVWLNDGDRRRLRLQYTSTVAMGATQVVSIFSPFWIINRTGLALTYAQVAYGRRFRAAGQGGRGGSGGGGSGDGAGGSGGGAIGDGAGGGGGDDGLTPRSGPLLFSYERKNLGTNQASVMVEGASWSNSINMDGAGTVSAFSVRGARDGRGTRRLYELGYDVVLGPGRFSRTRVVTFMPRFVVVNNTSHPLWYKQSGSDVFAVLAAGAERPYHWASEEEAKRLRITLDRQAGWEWSPDFAIDTGPPCVCVCVCVCV